MKMRILLTEYLMLNQIPEPEGICSHLLISGTSVIFCQLASPIEELL